MRRIDQIVPAAIIGCLTILVLIGVGLIYRAPYPETGAEFAAWVQAVGTVAAMIATAGVAWWVPWSGARERRAGLDRTAAYHLYACALAIGQLQELLDDQAAQAIKLFRPIGQRVGYDLSHYRGVLSSFPLHETDSRQATDSFLRMQNCLTRAEKVMEVYNASLAPGGAPGAIHEAAAGMAQIHDRASLIATTFGNANETRR